ncbi:MAG: HAMP domain-containing sensor histidine kinase, partial [Fulvivirga sp.]|nr:HAMP domain-containing sensor histidine kinase [Fulvivirga sp.]
SEAQQINFNPSLTNIKEFCKTIVEEVEHSFDKSHTIMLNVACAKKEVMVDEKLLRNILMNLLSNAIKFSPGKDKVLFDVICKNDTLTFIVKDWGMGIPQEDQESIFNAFHRTGNVSAIQGTGLGLAIVKKAVEIHGGTIKLESEEGEGTTFTVNIALS